MIYILSVNQNQYKPFTVTNTKTKRFTTEEWQEIIISISDHTQTMREFYEQIVFILKDYDAVHINNIDFLKNFSITQEVTAQIIINLSENIDFYLSGIKLRERLSVLFDILERKQVKTTYITSV